MTTRQSSDIRTFPKITNVHDTLANGAKWLCTFADGTCKYISSRLAKQLLTTATIFDVSASHCLGHHVFYYEWAGFPDDPTIEYRGNGGDKEFRAALLNVLKEIADRSEHDDAFYMKMRRYVRMMLSKYHALTTSTVSKKRIDVALWNYLPK